MTFVLVLHIIGAAIWLGANVAQGFLASMTAKASDEIRLWWSESAEKMAKTVYNVAGILILATGLYMVIASNDVGGYSFASKFVSIGLAAVIIGAVLGITVFAPRNRAIAAAIRAGDAEAEAKNRSTIMAFGMLDTLIVLFTIGVMVYKTGAEFKGF